MSGDPVDFSRPLSYNLAKLIRQFVCTILSQNKTRARMDSDRMCHARRILFVLSGHS